MPCNEMSTHTQERLKREAPFINLDHSLLVDKCFFRITIGADDRPIRLLLQEILWIAPWRRILSNRCKECIRSSRKIGSFDRKLPDAVPFAIAALLHFQTDEPSL